MPDGSRALGGAVTYAAVAASALGSEAAVVTRGGSEFLQGRLPESVKWHNVPAPCTTTFANSYDPAGVRRQSLVDEAPPICPEHVPAEWRTTRLLHVAPVMHELSAGVVELFSADFVGVSPQGWSRRVAPDGSVSHVPLELPTAIRDAADAVVVSEEDLSAFPQAAEELARHVPVVVVTLGRRGAYALAEGRRLVQPAHPAEAMDPTGAGDVFAAAFFVGLVETGDLRDALDFASAAAALAVEAEGLGGIGTRAAIAERQRSRR
jgi:sugar/nucleoside kinase (ribokinase family)